MALVFRPGDRGNDVVALQEALSFAILSYANSDEPVLVADGIYGPKTQRAVRIVQRRHKHLELDGVAGPQTLSELFEINHLFGRIDILPYGRQTQRNSPNSNHGNIAPLPLNPRAAQMPRPPPEHQPRVDSDTPENPSWMRHGVEAFIARKQAIDAFLRNPNAEAKTQPPPPVRPMSVSFANLHRIGVPVVTRPISEGNGVTNIKAPRIGYGLELSGGKAGDLTAPSTVKTVYSVKFLSMKFGPKQQFHQSFAGQRVGDKWYAKAQFDYTPIKIISKQWDFVTLSWSMGLSVSLAVNPYPANMSKTKGKVEVSAGNKFDVFAGDKVGRGKVGFFLTSVIGIGMGVEFDRNGVQSSVANAASELVSRIHNIQSGIRVWF